MRRRWRAASLPQPRAAASAASVSASARCSCSTGRKLVSERKFGQCSQMLPAAMTDPATFVASALDAGAPGAAAAIGGVSVVALVLLGVAVAGAGGAPGRAARGPAAVMCARRP